MICFGALADRYLFHLLPLLPSPGHDPNDYEIGKRFNLEMINIMNKVGGDLVRELGPLRAIYVFVSLLARSSTWRSSHTGPQDATLNAAAGNYAGLDRFEARKKLWADMEAAGLVIKKDNYTVRWEDHFFVFVGGLSS